MEITSIRINLIKNGERLKAVAQVLFDNCFVVKDIKIVEGKEGIFVAMPSKKIVVDGQEKYHDIAHPIAPGFRKDMDQKVLDAYNEELKKEAE